MTYPRDGAPEKDPIVAGDFSDWTAKIVDAVSRSWRRLFVLQAIVAVPVAFASALAAYSAGDGLTNLMTDLGNQSDITIERPGPFGVAVALLILFALIIGAMVQVASVWLIVKDTERPAPIAGALRFGVGRMLPLIGWEILAGLMIVVGFILIIPGIYLAVVMVPSLVGAVVFDRVGIKRCFQLARGQFFALFGRCLMALLFAAAYSQLVSLVIKLIFGSADSSAWGSEVVSGLLNLPLQVIASAFVVITYAELRGREGPTTARQLSAQLDLRSP